MAKKQTSGTNIASDIARDAAESTLALNPLVASRGQDLMEAYNNMMRAAVTQPDKLTRQWLRFASEMGNIMTLRS